MPHIASIAGRLALLIAGFLGWCYLIGPQQIRFGANAIPQAPNGWSIAYGYAMTVLGVILGSAYRELKTKRDRGERTISSVRDLGSSVFYSIDFWMSLCGSPLVYALILKQTDGGSFAGIAVMAIENGFCCTLIVNAFVGREEQAARTREARPDTEPE
jgi:hypothetical protein